MERVSYFKKSVFDIAIVWLTGWLMLVGVEVIFRLIKGPQPSLSVMLATLFIYGGLGLVIGVFVGVASLFFRMGKRGATQLDVKPFSMAFCISAIIFLYGILLVKKLHFLSTAGLIFLCLFILVALYLLFKRVISKSHLFSSFLALALSIDLFMIGGFYINEKLLPGKFFDFNLVNIVGNGGIIINCILLYFLSYYVFKLLSDKISQFFHLKTTVIVLTVFIIVGAIVWYVQTSYIPISKELSIQHADELKDKPNVILITMDTTRADHLSCYDYPRKTTPHLDKLAEESLLFKNAYSTASWTLPAHASIFTGLYPSKHGAHGSMDVGIWHLGSRLGDQYTTLAELLKFEGYKTAGVIGGSYCSSFFGLDQGFDYYSDDLLNVKPDIDYFMLYKIVGKFIPLRDLAFRYGYSGTRIACQINAIVFSWLDENYTQPFFLFINYFDAHSPFAAPRPYDTLYEGKNKEIIQITNRKEINYSVREWALIRSVLLGKHTLSKKEKEHFISQYDGKISYLDYHMGKLFQKLKELGIYDQTMIIITSDHGESFGEHHLMFHSLALYDNLLRVPLIIKYPLCMERTGTVLYRVSLIDILPEILTTLGIAMPDSVHQGIPLCDERRKGIIAENYRKEFFSKLSPLRFNRDLRTIVKGKFKYIWASNGKNELYDLSKDPHELNNVITELPQKAKEMHTSLNSFSFSDRDMVPQKKPAEMDEKIRENLRALGYVE